MEFANKKSKVWGKSYRIGVDFYGETIFAEDKLHDACIIVTKSKWALDKKLN